MAPTPSNKPVGLQIALTCSVLLFIIASVFAYLNNKYYAEANAKLIEAEKTLGNVKTLAANAENDVATLKNTVGANQGTVQSSDPQDPTTVTGFAKSKMVEAKGNAGNSLIETVDKLLQAYNATDADRAQIRANLTALQTDYQAQEDRYRDMADKHDDRAKKAEADKLDVIRTKDEALAAKDQEIADLKNQNNEKEAEIANLNERIEHVPRISATKSSGWKGSTTSCATNSMS